MKKVSTLKLNLMRAAMTLALIVTCATAWAQNPNLADYTFTTGQDANKWITLSGNATQMIGSRIDDANSSMTSIGFDFPFGDGTYSQFWTSSNGILSFNSEQAYTSQWQFHSNSNQYLANQPKICGISADMSTGNNGYVKYEVTGTAPNRVLVCEFFLYGGGFSTAVAATIKWQVQLYEANAKVVMVYGDATSLRSNQIGLSQSGSDIWTINPETHEAIHSTGSVISTSDTWPGAYRYYEFNPPVPFTNNGDGTYTIGTATGWDVFCDYINGGESFSGKTVYLANDIEVSRIAGSGNGSDLTTSDHPFCGTFDGQGNTLTFNYGSSDSPANENNLAPFRYVNDATIQHLHVSGDIYTQQKHTGGIVGQAYGTTNITDCHSSINIISSITGDGTHGGIMSCSWTGSTTNISGCLFDGSIQSADGYTTDQCGGFVGWKNATINVTNSLLTADLSTIGAATGETYPSATFVRHGVASDITNCYYVTALGTVQGKQRLSITADENVTVANAGTPVNVYTTSGITSYGTGIKYNDVLYAGSGDNVSLTLTNTPPQGSLFMGYTVSPEGTILNGNNPYTLTMPDENVTICAMMKGPVTYLDENGVQQTKQPSEYTILTNTMTTLGTADQETWYVADGTLNFNQTINVNGVVHLILKDNAVMNVGTEQNPISDSGISAEGPSISIYGQSTGENIGQLYVYATYCGIYDYDYYGNNNNPNYDYAVTINGGNIFVSASSYGIQSNKVTINGGQVSATAGEYGISSNPNAITLGWTSPYDFIFANNYQGDVIVKEGKTFTDGNGNVFSGTVDPASINGKTLYPAVAVTLNDGITAGSGIISSGENLYAQAAVPVTVDASGVTAPAGHAVSGITVTPTVTVTDNHDGTYSFTTPAANVTVSPTFELLPVSVNYLDADGVQQTVDALPLLGGGATTLAAGWYVVNSDISYTGTVTLGGSVNLILADDHTMNVGTSENRIEYGIKTYNNGQNLTIYGQSTGDHMGILSVYSSHYCIYPVALTINGGHVIANADGYDATALRTTYQTITINGGTVEATATGNGAYAIHAADNFTYAGGTLITNAASGNAIYAYYKRYTFTWRNPNDSITIGSTGFYDDNGSATATFTKAFTDGTNIYSGTLTGSQLNALAGKTLHPVTAYKTITAHSTPEQPVSGWYLIASPVGDVSATAVNNLANTDDNDGFDLYRFNQSAELEWENWKSQECEGNHYHFDLESGRGYLYANAEDVNLIFTGTPYSGTGEIPLTKATDAGIDFSGWNLVGNPFNETAYIDKTDFYRMNAEGSEIEVATDNAIAPMEGIFVLADENGETLTFSTQAPNKGHIQKPELEQIVLNLSRDRGSVIDRAIVRFIESRQLPKFQIRKNSTKIYIPQDGKDYAIVSVGNVSEIPVNFRANENGQYTISVNPEGVEMSYLHLIDNMTGADVDLLAAKVPELVEGPTSNNGVSTGSTTSYTFNAKTTDYESRFKLVFVCGDANDDNDGDNETFAFYFNGNWIIANDGDATLQVIDLNGRILSSESIHGSVSKSIDAAPGVYMIRLINGENVKVQKIVVR